MQLKVYLMGGDLCINYSSRKNYSKQEINNFCRLINILEQDKRKRISSPKIRRELGNYMGGNLAFIFKDNSYTTDLVSYRKSRLHDNMEVELCVIRSTLGNEELNIKIYKDFNLNYNKLQAYLELVRRLAFRYGFTEVDEILNKPNLLEYARENGLYVTVSTEYFDLK